MKEIDNIQRLCDFFLKRKQDLPTVHNFLYYYTNNNIVIF